MKFTFPSRFTFLEMLALARRGQFEPMAFRGQIELDFSLLNFAGPGAMACIKALLAREQRVLPPEVCFPVEHQFQDAVRYLERMDFFTSDIRWCMTPEGVNFIRHPAAGRFMPMRNLHELMETNLASREMVGCLTITDRVSSSAVEYVLSELIDNALQHSDSPTGAFVTAQKYEKWGKVHLLIVDTGIGIRGHLQKNPRHRHISDDMQAIKTALTPFVTGTYAASPDEQMEYDNQGLGLSVTNQVAKHSGGEFYIWTGRALYRSQSGEAEPMPVAWPGTVVFLSLPIKLAINITDIVKEFDAALKKSKIQLKFNK
jgi:hypothetical protein